MAGVGNTDTLTFIEEGYCWCPTCPSSILLLLKRALGRQGGIEMNRNVNRTVDLIWKKVYSGNVFITLLHCLQYGQTPSQTLDVLLSSFTWVI